MFKGKGMEEVNGVVLGSAVAILCGGVDQNGTPLIIFPTDSADLIDIYGVGDILGLLKEYVHLAGGEVAIVADLKHGWSEECVSKLTTLLDKLQTQLRDCVKVAYFVKPRARTKKSILHRQLSRLQSPGRLMSYQVVRVETFEELYGYIDKTQLTTDYGGTLQYNHVTWVDFYKKYISALKAIGNLKAKLPALKEETENIENRLLQANGDFAEHMKTIKTNYEAILRRRSARETITRCYEALEILDHPENDHTVAQIHASPMVETTTKLRSLYHDVENEIKALDASLAKKEIEYSLNNKLDECRRNSKEVIETIILMTHKISDLPRIGRNAVEAQEYRNEFLEEVLDPSKDIVDCATSIMQDLATGKNTTQKSYKATMEIARQLTESLQPFSAQMNKLNETYTRIHLFYVIYNKVVRWKERASKLIADTLVPTDDAASFDQFHEPFMDVNNRLQYSSTNDSHCDRKTTHGEEGNGYSELHERNVRSIDGVTVKAPPNWDKHLNYFYYKHPPPRRKHLRLITKFVSDFVDKPQLVEAETLAERTMFILAFLTKKTFKGEDIVRILQWRDTNGFDSSSSISSRSPEVTLV